MTDLLQLNSSDTVAVVLRSLKKGELLPFGGGKLRILDDIPAGHKVAVCVMAEGSTVVKYGHPIGTVTREISAGQWVHSHNMHSSLKEISEYSYQESSVPVPKTSRTPQNFMGFRREDGRVGIRNEVWIIPTVGCVSSVAKDIAARVENEIGTSVDGVYAFEHPYGCSQLGDDLENTRRALAGLIRHPNAGGVLVLGLGCENNSIADMKAALGPVDPNRVKFLVCQECGDEIEEGTALVKQLCDFAGHYRREPVPMSELIVGLKCGGSDGFSGITANRLLGVFADRLASEGGSAVMSEVPEMFGAETILLSRCVSQEVFDRTVRMINGFKAYFLRNGEGLSENPSPGNKAGGITTLEEKSLGCVQKGGNAPVVDAIPYGDPVRRHGVTLLSAPGNDLVSTSAEAVSGAHLILFTTGRGTPFGSPVPTVKISSNTALSQYKKNWIDFNAGDLLEDVSLEAKSETLYEFVRAIASGEIKTKNERGGMREIAIFKNGITL